MRERRDVKTGKFVDSEWGRHQHPQGTSWWVVTLNDCDPDCQTCEGYEISLHLAQSYTNESFCRSPVWPFLSASSTEEARALARKLMQFARTLPLDDIINDEGADPRVLEWLEQQGFHRRHRICWGSRPKAAT